MRKEGVMLEAPFVCLLLPPHGVHTNYYNAHPYMYPDVSIRI